MDDGRGKLQTFESVVTTSFIFIKGKVLVLYVHAEKSGLEWSKAASKTWVARIIAENPSTGSLAKQEQQSRSGFDWNKVLRAGLIGAAVGGGITLVRTLFKKKKPNA